MLLAVAVAVAGYMTYQNRALVPSAGLSEQISVLEAKNAELSAQMVSAENRHAEKLSEDIEGLKQGLGAELERKDGEIQELRDAATTIQLGSDVVFSLGSTILSSTGKAVLSKVSKLLENYPGYVVSLEGHTDDVPIKKARLHILPSNWELSAARASSAARFLIDQGVDPQRLKVVGYGFSRPIADNDSTQGRAKNRRLEIRFSPKPLIRVAQ